MQKKNYYNVIIVGGGISGTALLFTLAKYTNIKEMALFEKYNDIVTLNSNEKGNSQTLHCGDIETNKTATMLEKYVKLYNYTEKYMFKVRNAKKENELIDVYFNQEVDVIKKMGDKFRLSTNKGLEYYADYVVVNAGAHSLLLAHKMDYAENFSCIPIGGSFYYSKLNNLKSKVYTIQNPKLPFAAIHGDPDIVHDNTVRFGPTAIALPKLERYHHAHFIDFLESLSPSSEVLTVFHDLLADKDIRDYAVQNFLYEIPGIRQKLFAKEVQKILPSISEDDITFADGIGGLRPQVIDKVNKKLLLGEAKVDTGDGIVFNMTPSPGATSCLGNAIEDTKLICKFLDAKFKENKFKKELL